MEIALGGRWSLSMGHRFPKLFELLPLTIVDIPACLRVAFSPQPTPLTTGDKIETATFPMIGQIEGLNHRGGAAARCVRSSTFFLGEALGEAEMVRLSHCVVSPKAHPLQLSSLSWHTSALHLFRSTKTPLELAQPCATPPPSIVRCCQSYSIHG